MNSLYSIIESFEKIKNKGWIKVNDHEDDDFYFPNCNDIHIKCTSDNGHYPIMLLSLAHYLPKDLFNDGLYYYIETDSIENVLRVIVYQDNIILFKKDLIRLNDFEKMLNRNISRIAYIFCENKVEKNKKFFRYSKMNIYRFRGSNVFLKLLNQKIIKIKVNKNNIIFTISKSNFEKLYRKEYRFDNHLSSFLSFLEK